MTSLFCVLALAACGGSGDNNGPNQYTTLNPASCSLQYTETQPGNGTGSDPLLGNQWHLTNTGQFGGTPGEDLNIIGAWAVNQGESVRVAVIDDALEVTHEDLVANVVPDSSFNYRPQRIGSSFPMPCDASDFHGTAVGGIVAARDNNGIGVAGVAPKADLVGFNALATGLDADIADALGRDSGIVGVYNNSWGAVDDGRLNPSGSVFEQAIADGINTGRDGKGSIYVFPAGNGGCFPPNCGRENSNYDGYVNKRGVTTVCAVDNQGRQPSYGERGANFLVCAPSSNSNFTALVTTTGLQNTYATDFNGTSAATPMVSGVAALMLAANPNLTWRDVQQVLARTARQNDPTDSEWAFNFGLFHNPKYGFGVVDAAAAVNAVSDPAFVSVGDSTSQLACGPYVSNPNAALTDAVNPGSGNLQITPVNDAINVSGCAITRIEFIEVTLNTTHTYGGDLRVVLTSPNGLVSTLASERICAGPSGQDNCGNYDDWQFGSVRHLDEPAGGSWTLTVADAQADDVGTFNNWSLRLYGR